MAMTSNREAVRVPEQSVESSASAVEWAAIAGGALAAIGISKFQQLSGDAHRADPSLEGEHYELLDDRWVLEVRGLRGKWLITNACPRLT
jgi:hypothetical protein